MLSLYCRWDLNPHTPITRLMTVYKTGEIRQYFKYPGPVISHLTAPSNS